MPRFSWSTLPVFYHSANATGLFNSTSLSTIARYPLVTLEKYQGPFTDADFRAGRRHEEDNIIAQARAIKAANPNVSILSYTHRNVYPFYKVRSEFEAHEEWWFTNTTTHKHMVIRMPNFNCSSAQLADADGASSYANSYAIINDTTLLYGTTGKTRSILGASVPTLAVCVELATKAKVVEFTWHDSSVKGWGLKCVERTDGVFSPKHSPGHFSGHTTPLPPPGPGPPTPPSPPGPPPAPPSPPAPPHPHPHPGGGPPRCAEATLHEIDWANPAAAAHWSSQCAAQVASGAIDGCLVDGLVSESFGGASAPQVKAAVASMQKQVEPGLVIANNAYRGEYFPAAKGVMFEAFSGGGKDGQMWVQLMLMAVQQGMLVEAHAKCPPTVMDVAGFLVAAGQNSFFGCGDWYYSGGLLWYEIYDKPIGKPLGLAKVDSKVWTRSFASGTSVVLDFNHMNATINWASGEVMRSDSASVSLKTTDTDARVPSGLLANHLASLAVGIVASML
jgi:hypothetical protein